MNCKPGDMAYLSSDCVAEGVIVEVLSAAAYDGPPAWNVRSRTPVSCETTLSKKILERTEFMCEDKYLRPISGVPVHDEQHNEVMA